MRKLLLSLAAISAMALSAATVTFNAEVDLGSVTDYNNAGPDQVSKDGITISITNGCLGLGSAYRIYKSQTLTVTSEIGDITGIQFTCTANGGEKWGPGNFTVETGEYTFEAEGPTGTWAGAASEVVFTAAGNQVRATEIVVTTGGDAPALAAPRINPNGGTFTSPVEVTITAADDATIYYGFSLDDDFAIYTEPFTISETCSLYAYAQRGEEMSATVEAAFEIKEAETVATIADFLAAQPAENVVLAGDLTVTYDGLTDEGGYNAVFVKDATGTLLLYFGGGERPYTYTTGDVISGVQGKFSTYGEEPQMSADAASMPAPKSHVTVSPKEMTIAEINAAPTINEYVVLQGVDIDADNKLAKQGADEVAIYTRFKNVTLENLTATDVLALTARFKGTQQIYPIDLNYDYSGVQTIARDAKKSGIYNLQGMKVNEMIPGQLYIVDGKKVIATR